MTDQLISFKTAKLAKEKGFNEQCKMIHIDCPEYPNWHDKIGTYDTMPHLVKGCKVTNIPTQSLLQKWLREKHNIHIFIGRRININKWDSHAYSLLLSSKEYIKERTQEKFHNQNIYDTYEEALEQGLIEALKLIKL